MGLKIKINLPNLINNFNFNCDFINTSPKSFSYYSCVHKKPSILESFYNPQ